MTVFHYNRSAAKMDELDVWILSQIIRIVTDYKEKIEI